MKKSITIMLVDDDVDDMEIFREVVYEIDPSISCMYAENGAEAFRILNEKNSIKPHLIFLDIHMPGVSGPQFLSELKKHPEISEIPVVMYSTSNLVKDIEESKRAGATKYLSKPSSLRELERELSKIIETMGYVKET